MTLRELSLSSLIQAKMELLTASGDEELAPRRSGPVRRHRPSRQLREGPGHEAAPPRRRREQLRPGSNGDEDGGGVQDQHA